MPVRVAEDDSRAYVTSNDNRINLELALVYRATFSDCKESGMLAYQYNRYGITQNRNKTITPPCKMYENKGF